MITNMRKCVFIAALLVYALIVLLLFDILLLFNRPADEPVRIQSCEDTA